MLIHLVLVTQGITREELGGRLGAGWVHAGRQAVRACDTILDPSKRIPPSGVVGADVWMLPGPMRPAWGLLHLTAASAVVGGWEAALESDLGDALHPPVVRAKFLERAVDIAPADAAGAEDLAQSHDDGWRLGSLDAGQLEAAAGIAAQGLGEEGALRAWI